MTLPRLGDRMRLKHDVDRFPHFIAAKGSRGTVTSVDEDAVCLKLDKHLPGAEEWDNEVCWYPSNGDDIYRDAVVVVTLHE